MSARGVFDDYILINCTQIFVFFIAFMQDVSKECHTFKYPASVLIYKYFTKTNTPLEMSGNELIYLSVIKYHL